MLADSSPSAAAKRLGENPNATDWNGFDPHDDG